MSTNPFRVAVLDDYERLAHTVPAYEDLTARAEVTIFPDWIASSEAITRTLRDFDCLLLMRERTRLSEKEYGDLPNLKFIAQTGRTVGHLDLPAATRRGIAVAQTSTDNGATTKELTVALILSLLRRIPQVSRRMRDEAWPAVAGLKLEGKTVGIIGLGRIGSAVASLMHAFNARVLAYSPTLTPERAAAAGAESVPMDTVLREADIVTLHVQLRPETRGLLGERELALMKPGALLVNTARGPLVDEAALIKALTAGRLGGVGLDVFDIEPLPKDHPLRRFDNAILTSHRGYATTEILSERYEQAMRNILDFLDDKPLRLLNPEVRPTGAP